MSRLIVVIYRDGRTILVVEESLTPEEASDLSAAWERAVAAGGPIIVPDATVQTIDADFVEGKVTFR